MARVFAEHSAYAGIIVVIDELGQYLDFAARQDDERDLFVLQSLAEMTMHSGGVPCLLLTILHQAFERYTLGSGPTRRIEWAKVQGRFVDLPFQEPVAQMIRMVAHALRPADDDPYHVARARWATLLAADADTLGLRPAAIPPDDWTRLVAQAYPLHPTVLIALPYLFRQLAQNERSLFAFLHADEPSGLRDIVSLGPVPSGQLPIYRLNHLFAYVESALGPSLFARARGQRWAELAESRAALGTAEPLLLDVLTIIGVIGALERSSGLRASRQQIAFALADQRADTTIEDALVTLQTRRQITYRQHRDSYILWEGSDLDLDAFAQDARRTIGDSTALSTLLQQYADTTPQIARRHSYRTGATRTFAVRYMEVASLRDPLALPADADGELLYVVPADDEELRTAIAWACAPIRDAEPQRIVVMPRRVRELRELLLDVAALQHVLDERPELEHDRVARREVASRLIEAQQLLGVMLTDTYGSERSHWYRRGAEARVATAKQVDDLLSTACDETYAATPHIWNELIVRRQLSTAAAKARRNLVEAMLAHPHEPNLGLVGYPPERAMYESVLVAGGLHRVDPRGEWCIMPPPERDPLRLIPVWAAMVQFLDTADTESRPLVELYATLKQPPYGLKAGLIPLLFVALYAARAGEIVLYERGNYVPIPDLAIFERILTRPEHFALRQSRATGTRLAVYTGLARAFAPRALEQPVQPALLAAAMPLLRVAHELPAFSKQTQRVSERAQAIRAALHEARAPDELLFERLPVACGFPPFRTDDSDAPEQLEHVISVLREGLQELQQAYQQLIALLVTRIGTAFRSAAPTRAALRTEIQARLQRITDTTNDTAIRALGVRLETADEQGDAWIESVASLLAKRAPALWSDRDIATFEVGITDLGRRFQAAEELALVVHALPKEAPVLRIGLARGRGEVSRVLHMPPNDPAIQQLHAELNAVLAQHQALTADQRAAALATLLETLLEGYPA